MEKKITKEELLNSFFTSVRDDILGHQYLTTKDIWAKYFKRLIEPYLDESKFISKDEQEFEEWYKKTYPDGVWLGVPASEVCKRAWLASRGK